jgi:hypothetical protein
MGYKAMQFLNDIANGKGNPQDPTYTGSMSARPRT